MTHRLSRLLIASLSATALVFAATEADARSGAAAHGGFTAHPGFRPGIAHGIRHHRAGGVFWPGYGYDDSSYSDGGPFAQVPPVSNDVHYTYTYDVPWDWAHRYPPNVVPSDRPYVPGCTAEAVTVPGSGGGTQTVNVTRCY
jgi:hypothetical protein